MTFVAFVLSAATVISIWSIYLQLKSYRRPLLQRSVVRIMLMYVPALILHAIRC